MSVFRAASNVDDVNSKPREPYPINRAKEDGPTEQIDGTTKPPRRRNGLVWVAVLVAVLALVIAAVAALASWRAVTIAADKGPQPVVGPVAAPPTPQVTDFSVTYAQEPLRVQVGCSAVLFLDLDEPRANAGETVSDLRYDSRCGQDVPRLTLGPGAAAGAQVKDGDTDAAGCAKAIRTSPLGPGANVEVRKGAVLCVLSAATPASMALVEITDVGKTGTAGMRATSWKVTG